MTVPTITVMKRGHGPTPRAMRRGGTIPGVLYGHTVGNVAIACEEKPLEKVLRSAGESTIIELHLDASTVPVLVSEVQRHPVSDRLTHVDFYAIDLTKKVRTGVPTVAIGTAPAVKDLGGILVHQLQRVTVECLPKELPATIEVDISGLANFHDKVTVSALRVGDTVRVLDDREEIVFTVVPPREEEKEEEKPVETVEGVTVEGAAPAAAEGAGAAPADAAKKGTEPKEKSEKK